MEKDIKNTCYIVEFWYILSHLSYKYLIQLGRETLKLKIKCISFFTLWCSCSKYVKPFIFQCFLKLQKCICQINIICLVLMGIRWYKGSHLLRSLPSENRIAYHYFFYIIMQLLPSCSILFSAFQDLLYKSYRTFKIKTLRRQQGAI